MSPPSHTTKVLKEEENEEDNQNNEQMNDDQTETSEEENDQDNVDDNGILIKAHEHYLHLRHEDDSLSRECQLCHRDIKPPFYGCAICEDYCVHKLCGDYLAQLRNKQIIYHPFHTSHGPLSLIYGYSGWCHSCHQSFENVPFFICIECLFVLDFRCALMPDQAAMIASLSQQQCTSMVKHISHQHSLLLIDDKDNDQVITKCFACHSKLTGSGQAYYGCVPCGYFLDKFCAEFPMEFQHPLHDPQHGLLTLHVNRVIKCSVCERKKDGPCNLSLKCQQCEFWLCWKCNLTVKKGNINCEDHEHLLCFVKDAGTIRCDGYDAYCRQSLVASHSKEFDLTKSSVLKCLDCDFRLHLLCGPLPSTIKYELHIHSLTLYDSFLEDNSGEYYCDVCETQRDPRIRVYCCVECKYFAHVHCLISEIVDYFYVQMGELDHSDVKLKALGEDSWRKSSRKRTGLTLNDLLLQLQESDKKQLKYYFKWDESWHKDSKVPPKDDDDNDIINVQLEVVGDEDINKIIEISRFTEESFMRYCEEDLMGFGKKIKLEASELALKLVEVKGYMIPHSLAGVLETLLDECKHNIIPDRYEVSLELKSLMMFILCKVVKRMRNTMVQDITSNLLQDWRSTLQFLKDYGLDIGFVIEKLEKATRAFVGRQASRLEREVPAILHSRMVELQSRIRSYEEYRDSEKNEFMKGCLKEESESMWKTAY